jgi:hypothetical protein
MYACTARRRDHTLAAAATESADLGGCAAQLNVTMKWEPEEEADVPHQKVFGANSADASEEDPGPSSSGRDLWIGGIPESFLDGITVEDATKRLREMCDTFGETDTVTIRKKLGPGSWALVQFAEPESMDRAIAAGLTTDDGVELRVKEADVYGTISEGKSDGMLFQLAQHHGLKKLKPGILWVIVNSGEELAPSKKVIRDLSTYVDYGQLLNSLGVLFGYILIAFIFYRVSSPSLRDEIAAGRSCAQTRCCCICICICCCCIIIIIICCCCCCCCL